MNTRYSILSRLDSHHRVMAAIGVAALVFGFGGEFRWPVRILASWNAFALCSLALAWMHMLSADAKTTRHDARLQDSSQTAIFLFVIVAAVASLFAVGYLLIGARGLGSETVSKHILLAGLTVATSWFLTQTVFTLRYAHIYYEPDHTGPEQNHHTGLNFPQERHPGYIDFAYFSFVIGMTCQVSDVDITSKRMRRIALVHGLLSFAFNTAILAFCINVSSGLI